MALTLAGAVCLVVWGDRSSSSDRPVEVASPTVAARPAAPIRPPVRDAPLPRPVRLGIPDIGVATALTGLGLQADGTVEVPANPLVAGWYRLGPPPGAVGSAVILGHVDSVDGPAVFARLGELDRGDRVHVGLDDGSTVTYVVRTVRLYPNADFPAHRVYGGHGRRELKLVTCGGAYDSGRGGYQANLVVNARWLSGQRSPSPGR